jgi:hypothetical protein
MDLDFDVISRLFLAWSVVHLSSHGITSIPMALELRKHLHSTTVRGSIRPGHTRGCLREDVYMRIAPCNDQMDVEVMNPSSDGGQQ